MGFGGCFTPPRGPDWPGPGKTARSTPASPAEDFVRCARCRVPIESPAPDLLYRQTPSDGGAVVQMCSSVCLLAYHADGPGPQWLDRPTRDGFWWLRSLAGKHPATGPVVVEVRVEGDGWTVYYSGVECFDTSFDMAREGRVYQWLPIDPPAEVP